MNDKTHKPLSLTDRRRTGHRRHTHQEATTEGEQGAGKPLAHLFNDRRKNLGTGKRAS